MIIIVHHSSSKMETTINFDDINMPPLTSIKEEGTQTKGKRKVVEHEERWRWTDNMVAVLVKNLLHYKHAEEAEGNDFEGDLVRLYSELRISMSMEFSADDFGPTTITMKDTEEMSKEEVNKYRKKIKLDEDRKKRGYQRIREKVKSLRNDYRKAIDSGRRSGSGRLVQVHFLEMKEIWGGSPAVQSIEEGFDSMHASSLGWGNTSRNEAVDDEDYDVENRGENEQDVGDLIFEDIGDLKKRKLEGMDLQQRDSRGKNRNMTKKLSMQQRDMMFYNLAVKENEQRNKQMELFQRSMERSTSALSSALQSIGDGISSGLASLSQSFVHQTSSQPQVVPSTNMDILGEFLLRNPTMGSSSLDNYH